MTRTATASASSTDTAMDALQLIASQLGALRDSVERSDTARSAQHAENQAALARIESEQKIVARDLTAHQASDKEVFERFGREIRSMNKGKWIVRGTLGASGGTLIALIKHILGGAK